MVLPNRNFWTFFYLPLSKSTFYDKGKSQQYWTVFWQTLTDLDVGQTLTDFENCREFWARRRSSISRSLLTCQVWWFSGLRHVWRLFAAFLAAARVASAVRAGARLSLRATTVWASDIIIILHFTFYIIIILHHFTLYILYHHHFTSFHISHHHQGCHCRDKIWQNNA